MDTPKNDYINKLSKEVGISEEEVIKNLDYFGKNAECIDKNNYTNILILLLRNSKKQIENDYKYREEINNLDIVYNNLLDKYYQNEKILFKYSNIINNSSDVIAINKNIENHRKTQNVQMKTVTQIVNLLDKLEDNDNDDKFVFEIEN
mgnify:CR=1 FL=1